ncbi:MAG: methionine--tRNA ligase [Leptolyngbyaceae cyanobacterium bins.302]|nr:methionine--tRNA ligase [Leptolyngbyaceae cyanobacterium bins.302]
MSAKHSDNNQFVITTPLYYVNAMPHMGSAYPTIAADVLARFHRLRGYATLFVTGTDEHGQKIQRAAETAGRDLQEHCDQIVAQFKALWELLDIQSDRFIRTTDPRHEKIVKEFYQRVRDQGDIYLGQQQGWYCVACEEFKEERDLLADHHCPIHTNLKAEWRDEANYFFRLSKYQDKLEQLYAEKPDFIQPDTRRNEVTSFVSQGLQDFSISRVNVSWGIPVPSDPRHTLYVWFDALLGYVTALLEPDQEPTLENALARWYPVNVHLIGKDILRFHAVYWPAMLMSAGVPLPDRVFGHGYLTKDGQKMGKSLGNTLDPFDLVRQYGADAVRYYFLKEIEFGRDGDFSQNRFINILNADLANDLGNLLNRTLKMALKYCDGKVPAPIETLWQESAFVDLAKTLGDRVTQSYGSLAFSQACEAILTIARAGNKFIDEQAPWTLYKKEQQATADHVIYTVLEAVRLAAYLLSPVIPAVSTAIYQQLGFSIDFSNPTQVSHSTPFLLHSSWGALPIGQALAAPQPVFQRLELLESVSI